MLEIAHVWEQAWENLFEREASCEEERLCVLASLCLSTTLHLFLYWYKRNTAEYTKTHIALWRGNTIHKNYIANTDRKQDIPPLYTPVFTEKMIRASHRDTHEFMMPPHPHHEYSQKGSSLICGWFFSFWYKRGPLPLFTVPPKSTHSLRIGPDLHMKWYPSFSSTLAPLSAHMPGSEEAGKAHNWSVSLGWKSVTRVSPPRSTQEWLNTQIYWEIEWTFCSTNTGIFVDAQKHFFCHILK